MLSVTVKDLKILIRDWGALITLFLSPLMFIIVMSLALGQAFGNLGQGSPVRLLLVNDDADGALSASFVTELETAASRGGILLERRAPNDMPLDPATAERLIVGRQRSMAVLIPPAFSARVEQGEQAAVQFVMDPGAAQQVVRPVQGMVEAALAGSASRFATRRSITAALAAALPGEAAADISQRLEVAFAQPTGGAAAQLDVSTPAGMVAPKYPSVFQQNVPGYTIMYVFFIVMTMALSVLQERRDGMLRRLLAAPVSKAAILAGKLLTYYMVTLLQVTVLFGVGALVFRMDLGVHPLGLVLITLALSACAVSLGLLLAAFARSDQQVLGVGTIVVLVLAALGGSMVPPVFMPEAMASLARITPHGWALSGYQDVMVRGALPTDVLPNAGVLLAFASVFFLVAVRRFRFD